MPETNPQNQNNNQQYQYRARRNFFNFLLKILEVANLVLNFFSLKQSKQFWGIVYDSVTKQPLDPVIVKLIYVDGSEVETCITDMAGRYGFLARPGKFKIFARKTNYMFPSKLAPKNADGIYDNLYHGEFFSLYRDYEVVAPNIPMDPASADWNQKAKLSVIKNHPFIKYFIKILAAGIFWIGFILALALIYKTFPQVSPGLYIAAVVYLFLLVLAVFLPDARLWGMLKAPVVIKPGESLFLELRDAKFPDISFGKAVVKEDGRFLLRANKGGYSLLISRIDAGKNQEVLASLKVKIGREGVFNSTVTLA
jgi:hypothetical protein